MEPLIAGAAADPGGNGGAAGPGRGGGRVDGRREAQASSSQVRDGGLIDFDESEHDPDQGGAAAAAGHRPLSFKRRQKQTSLLPQSARSVLSVFGLGGHGASASPYTSSAATTGPYANDDNDDDDDDDRGFETQGVVGGAAGRSKGAADAVLLPGSRVDWYAEGQGRRVGYEDRSTIDWIFEANKERQRQRALVAGSRGGGVRGRVRRLLDAGQVWVVLVLTGLAAGALAAGIDVASDWLGDLKAGVCAAPRGAWYLNHGFCCWGYEGDGSGSGSGHCPEWRPWPDVVGVPAAAGLGRWLVAYAAFVALSVAAAAAAALLVREYSVHARHSGIPEIKTVLGGFVLHGFLGGWTLVTKALGLCLAVASGMWLGKEGPFVHVACCCANLFSRLFPSIHANEARKREVLSAASASGISVAFGAPIGGVLFSLEVCMLQLLCPVSVAVPADHQTLSYYFPDKTMWQSFVCAMMAALTLQGLDPFRSGKLVLYQVHYSAGWHAFELVPFMLLGVFGGLYGALFIKVNMAIARWKKANSSRLPGPVAQVVAVALVTALINYPNLYMRAQSTELVSSLFTECTPAFADPLGLCSTGAATAATIVLLLFAAVLGFFLAAATFGLQIPAGIVLPSMAIGALTGRAVGIVVEMAQRRHPGFVAFAACAPDGPCVVPGTYAIVGAAAALTGVTRVTVSIVVIVFELTGALTYVLPIMVAVMLAKWVGDGFSRRGIYEAWIQFNQYPYLDNSGAEDDVLVRMPGPDNTSSGVPTAAQVLTPVEALVVLTATGHTVASLQRVLAAHPFRGFPVVADARDAVLLGYIARRELAFALHAATQPPRALPPADTEAFFAPQPLADPRTTLDLRPWMDQTPLTLPSRASLHLVVRYFQTLGLRHLLLTDRGVLQGLLTKKDVWYVLNGGGDRADQGFHFRAEDEDADDEDEHHGQDRQEDAHGTAAQAESLL